MEITTVKTFYDFGHNFLKNQPFWLFFIRILAISYEKNLATLVPLTPLLPNPFFQKVGAKRFLAISLLPNQHSIPGVSHKKMVWILGSFSEFTMFLPFF